jgi:hypothetical protein
MTRKQCLFLLIIAAICFAAGLLVGRSKLTPRDTATDELSAAGTADMTAGTDERPILSKTSPSKTPKERTTVAVKKTDHHTSKSSSPDTAGATTKMLLHSEIEKALRDAAKTPQNKLYEKLSKLALAVEVSDIAYALKCAESILPRNVQTYFAQNLLSRWAKADPRAALSYAESMPMSMARNQAIQTVVRVWAGEDATSAVAWVRSLPEGLTKQQALNGVIYPWAQAAPQATRGTACCPWWQAHGHPRIRPRQ